MIGFFFLVWNFIKTHWRAILIGIAIIIVLSYVAGISNYCGPKPKIDLETVQKINNANQKERIEELTKTITEHSDVIKDVNNQTELTNLETEERNRQIDAKVKEVDKKIQEAKSQGKDVTQEELQCLLVPSDCG